ncbi:MAG: MoaD/ThiS family protein [Pseudomonadota bacterium]|jgi:molybdopterin synthase sulfur carrier subunit|nr:MoaD/ThiS family protein [Pseudomonadota bacterium]
MKKTLSVRYFAGFRDHAGIDEESVTMDVSTAADLFSALADRHGSREPLGHCKVAINDEMADWDTAVNDGDTILLFPPVAGG